MPGERVAVIGGGAVGQLTALASLALGAREVVLVEPKPARRASAMDEGVPVAVDPSDANRFEADLAVECCGAPAGFTTRISAARPTGRVVLVGITPASPPLPTLELVRYERDVIGSLSHVYDEDFLAALGLINNAGVGGRPHSAKDVLGEALSYVAGHAALPPGVVKVVVHPRGSIGSS